MPRKTPKQVREELQAKREAENKIFRLYEYIQRAEDGGHPVPNGEGFGHGEPVYVVSKRELMELALGVRELINKLAEAHAEKASFDEMLLVFEASRIAERILAEDQFVEPLRMLGTPRPDR
jgi:hypothetical protein